MRLLITALPLAILALRTLLFPSEGVAILSSFPAVHDT